MIPVFRTQVEESNLYQRNLFLICLLSFLLQIFIASQRGVGDSYIYMQWLRALTQDGLAEAYWDKPVSPEGSNTEAYYRIDYPPVYPYVLYLEGHAIRWFSQDVLNKNSIVLFWIKFPLIVANILICILLFYELRTVAGEKIAWMVSSFYAFSPPILFNTCYWGQSDSLFVLLILLSLILLRKKPEIAWFLFTIGFLMKPLGYIYGPLLLFETYKRFGWKRILSIAGISLLTSILIFVPFLRIHRFHDIFFGLLLQVDAAPYVSANANNFWWLITGGLPQVSADLKILGPLTSRILGILLFTAFYGITLWKYAKSNHRSALYFAAASVSFAFFSLLTHMHENHLVPFLALLSLVWWLNPELKRFYYILTVTVLANLLLYDLLFIYLSLPGLFLTLLNSLLNVLLFIYWIFTFYSFKSFDPVLEGDSRLLPSRKRLVPILICLIGIGMMPLLIKASRFRTEHFFLLNLKSAQVNAPNSAFTYLTLLNIPNDIRPVLFEHPPCEIRFHVKIPNRAMLKFGITMSPSVWSAGKGDGVLFEIFAEDRGVRQNLFSKYIDPKNKISDRRWHDEAVDLSAYSQKEITIVFATSAGPLNDTRFDWAMWGDPRILTP